MRQQFPFFAALLLAGCPGASPEAPDAGNGCVVDNQCEEGYICFNQVCVFPPTFDAGPGRDTGPRTDLDAGGTPDAGSDVFSPDPIDAGPTSPEDAGPLGPCRGHADCPAHAYCNVRDEMCVPLPPGRCRDDSVCAIACEIAEGAPMGRCIDCEGPEHCPATTNAWGGSAENSMMAYANQTRNVRPMNAAISRGPASRGTTGAVGAEAVLPAPVMKTAQKDSPASWGCASMAAAAAAEQVYAPATRTVQTGRSARGSCFSSSAAFRALKMPNFETSVSLSASRVPKMGTANS